MPRMRIPQVRGTDPEWTRTLETGKGQGGPAPGTKAPSSATTLGTADRDAASTVRQAPIAKPQSAFRKPQPAPRAPHGQRDASPGQGKVRVEVRVRPDPAQTERLRALAGPKAPEDRILALAAKRATSRLALDPHGPAPSDEKLRRDGTPSGRMVLFLPAEPVEALREMHDPFELLQLSALIRPQAEPLFRAELEGVLADIEARF